ncbi:ATP-binding protein [Microlunatus antarcticus]|uniref:Signal transduction histidine kinase/phage shock protein PspC (Stress-responsive transcriptional regulator) n=1 Tax=Microlunatus antarcticus TaxID=53388 RepID=A0A7W5JSN3_9ACTN|nr:ATP-binding protein [Microlunatus antarcticus]MBB3325614.1 signal transduction histidine kinase/phage shock protein PspC (stress-responsive transcriptional regulator) [Microlunatus antarcticus]
MTTLEPGRAPQQVTAAAEPAPASYAARPPAPATPGAGLEAGAPAAPTTPPVRRAVRVSEGAVLGGVCMGLAQYFGWPVLVVRIVFVGLALAQFFGVLAYGALWLLMPAATTATAPGLESATRTGLRPGGKTRRPVDWGTVLALAALGTGLLWLVQTSGLGVSQRLFWPVAFACAGAALVWRQADTSAQQRWRAEAGGRVWLAPLVARGGWPALVRVIVGLGLVGAAFGLVVAQYNQLSQLPQVLAMTLLALAGLAVVLAPWLHRSRSALNEARAEKVRADERADMAAHLHDSVLQTLALIQRQAEDPRAVQQLARRQERELRGWLYADDVPEASLRAALTAAAAEVEDERGVPVEVVMVGDCETSDAVQALVRAAREAMVNAAKHSGADKIDVYAEVTDTEIEVFVRDRGAGFDVDAVADDRYGVRGSILNRMTRHGGRASIRSRPGDGTEVRLEVTR